MKSFAAEVLFVTVLAITELTGAGARAQCPFTSVATQSVAPGCNFASTGFCAIVSTPTTLGVTLDAAACALRVDVVAFQGCGATIPVFALALGAQQINLPLPDFGPTCTLAVLPAVLVADASGQYTLPLPAALPPLSFLAQGFALSVPPLASQPIFTLSDALAVSLQ